MRRILLVVSLVSLTVAMSVHAVAAPSAVKRARYPAPSPDGKTLVFSYMGDLWIADAAGGAARRLTIHPSTDTTPLFSPDGKTIAFASNRNGSYNVYLMPVEGGAPQRLTFGSSAEYPDSFSPDGKWLLIRTGGYGAQQDIWKVPLAGGTPIRLTWDNLESKYFAALSPDGKRMAFCLNGSTGGWRRRGFLSSYNADIWVSDFTMPLGDPKRLTSFDGEDYWPMWSTDGRSLYFVSDRTDTPNIWKMGADGSGAAAVTTFTSDGIRYPQMTRDGRAIFFEYDSEIWRLDVTSGKSQMVALSAPSDDPQTWVSERTIANTIGEYAVSPDGKLLAYTTRGALFVASAADGGLGRLLAGPPWRNGSMTWAPDNRRLAFVSDRGGSRQIYITDLEGKTTPLTSNGSDATAPLWSPDGKWIVYYDGTHRIAAMSPDGGQSKTVAEGYFEGPPDGTQPQFSWSKDSKWLAITRPGTMFEGNVWVVNLDTGQTERLTELAKDSSRPQWSADGKRVYFTNSTYGNSDIYSVTLQYSKAEFEEDALDKILKGESAPGGGPMGRRPGAEGAPAAAPGGAAPSEPKKDEPVTINFDRIYDRLTRHTTFDAGAGNVVLTADGKEFIFTSTLNQGQQIWKVPVDGGRLEQLTSDTAGKGGLTLSADGKRLYYLSGGALRWMSPDGRSQGAVSVSSRLTIDRMEENRQVFQEAWWVMDRIFYDPDHHGVDWNAIRSKYEALLPYVPLKEDFYDMLVEMVFELNASHLGVTAPQEGGGGPGGPPGGGFGGGGGGVGYLGVEWDWVTLDQFGVFKVAKVYPGSPAANPETQIKVGEYLIAVNGRELNTATILDDVMSRTTGRKTVLLVNVKPSREGAREVALQPISGGAMSNLSYEAWVEWQRDLAAKQSNGRVGYVHIRGMSQGPLDRFYKEVTTKAGAVDAVVVDVRYNGGGRTAHDILRVIETKPFSYMHPRGAPTMISEDFLLNQSMEKPTACLINGRSASNSEMFAEGYKSKGLGPVVGMPTMGAVIATGGFQFLDGGSIRTPGWGVYAPDGENMEINARQPDYRVLYDPVAIRNGRDPQLEKAVDLLMATLAQMKGPHGPALPAPAKAFAKQQ